MADGRVFTGRQALDAGLIDRLGYLEDAIGEAAVSGGITDIPRVIRYSMFSALASFLGGAANLGGLEVLAAWLDRVLAPAIEFRWVP